MYTSSAARAWRTRDACERSRRFSKPIPAGDWRWCCRPAVGSPMRLLGLVAAAEQQAADVADRLPAIRQRHVDIARDAAHAGRSARLYIEQLDKDCRDVQGSLETVRLIRSAPGAVRDLVVGLRRDLVDAPVHAVSHVARPAARARALARRARRDSRRVGRARPGRALAGIARERPAGDRAREPTRR